MKKESAAIKMTIIIRTAEIGTTNQNSKDITTKKKSAAIKTTIIGTAEIERQTETANVGKFKLPKNYSFPNFTNCLKVCGYKSNSMVTEENFNS